MPCRHQNSLSLAPIATRHDMSRIEPRLLSLSRLPASAYLVIWSYREQVNWRLYRRRRLCWSHEKMRLLTCRETQSGRLATSLSRAIILAYPVPANAVPIGG